MTDETLFRMPLEMASIFSATDYVRPLTILGAGLSSEDTFQFRAALESPRLLQTVAKPMRKTPAFWRCDSKRKSRAMHPEHFFNEL